MKIRKLMAGLTLAATMATAMMPVSAFAQVNEEDIIAEEQEEVTEEPTEEPEEIISYGPLTPDGNLTIIDDYGDPTKAGKQFITVSSKNGNIFYIIIDRDDEGENTVHFLNLVDERDLLTLMDEEEIEELMGPVEVEPTPTPEPEEPKEEVSVINGDFDGFIEILPYILKAIHILNCAHVIEVSDGFIHLGQESMNVVNCNDESAFTKKAIEASKNWSEMRFIKEVLHNV